jgi:hypothetical protein
LSWKRGYFSNTEPSTATTMSFSLPRRVATAARPAAVNLAARVETMEHTSFTACAARAVSGAG